METRTLLEMLRMEITEEMGTIGPFIFKKELANLGIKEERFSRLDAVAVVKRTTELFTALYGTERASEIEKRLLRIVSGQFPEPHIIDPLRRDPNRNSPPMPSKKFDLKPLVDILKEAGGGTEG